MDHYPWQLENYFFTHQEVRANPDHDPDGNRRGSCISPLLNKTEIEGRPNAVGLEVSITLDESQSNNPPYFFTVTAFGVLVTDLEITDQLRDQAVVLGIDLLIGAIRERVATLTSRAPWGAFVLGPIPPGRLNVPPAHSDG